MLTLAIGHLKHAPLGATLWLAVPGLRHAVAWTSSRAVYGRAGGSAGSADPFAAFSPLELEAYALALERDRLRPGDLLEHATRKLREPRWRLTAAVALNGANPPPSPQPPTSLPADRYCPAHVARYGPTLGQLARLFGARLVRVDFDGNAAEADPLVTESPPGAPALATPTAPVSTDPVPFTAEGEAA